MVLKRLSAGGLAACKQAKDTDAGCYEQPDNFLHVRQKARPPPNCAVLGDKVVCCRHVRCPHLVGRKRLTKTVTVGGNLCRRNCCLEPSGLLMLLSREQ